MFLGGCLDPPLARALVRCTTDGWHNGRIVTVVMKVSSLAGMVASSVLVLAGCSSGLESGGAVDGNASPPSAHQETPEGTAMTPAREQGEVGPAPALPSSAQDAGLVPPAASSAQDAGLAPPAPSSAPSDAGSAPSTPVTPSQPPPSPLSQCAGRTVVDVGDLKFDGTQLVTSGMVGSAVMVGRIVVPSPLPPGYYGKQASAAAFSWTSATAWKRVTLSKTPCDFSGTGASVSQGLTASVSMTFGTAGLSSVTMQPGEVWYLNIEHVLPSGAASCPTGVNCDFGVRVYPPGA